MAVILPFLSQCVGVSLCRGIIITPSSTHSSPRVIVTKSNWNNSIGWINGEQSAGIEGFNLHRYRISWNPVPICLSLSVYCTPPFRICASPFISSFTTFLLYPWFWCRRPLLLQYIWASVNVRHYFHSCAFSRSSIVLHHRKSPHYSIHAKKVVATVDCPVPPSADYTSSLPTMMLMLLYPSKSSHSPYPRANAEIQQGNERNYKERSNWLETDFNIGVQKLCFPFHFIPSSSSSPTR